MRKYTISEVATIFNASKPCLRRYVKYFLKPVPGITMQSGKTRKLNNDEIMIIIIAYYLIKRVGVHVDIVKTLFTSGNSTIHDGKISIIENLIIIDISAIIYNVKNRIG